MLAALVGGIGLFLLGMILMTEGLKAVAGDALRDILARFTGGRLSGVLSGAAVTSLVQSSSATVLATIGFVSAGLLTLPQAVAVIFGAAVGTTSTGWLVSLLGLKFSISAIALPLVAIGALARMLGRGWIAHAGLAVAGFGLIFIGIDTLQAGMSVVAERIDFAVIGGPGVFGRLVLVGVGVLTTVVMQSSSAAIATTLTALYSGAVTLDQAAALVIGQNIGTAVTAALASIGASVPARRTALSQILFNAFTGVSAFVLLPLYMPVLGTIAAGITDGGGAISIAAFHTAFNLIGVAILLPFLHRFTRMVERLVPERSPALTRHLDLSVAAVPAVAVDAAAGVVREVHYRLAVGTIGVLRGNPRADQRELLETLAEVRRFLEHVRTRQESGETHARHVSVLHAVEHLERLGRGLGRPPSPRSLTDPSLNEIRLSMADELEAGSTAEAPDQGALGALSRRVAEHRKAQRSAMLERTAEGRIDTDGALRILDATRWIDRAAYHLWRAAHHLRMFTPTAPFDLAHDADLPVDSP